MNASSLGSTANTTRRPRKISNRNAIDHGRGDKLTTVEQKSFSSFKFDLIDGMAFAPRVKGNIFNVGVGIVQHLNGRTLICWPSMDVLAAELNLSRTTVKGSIAKLEQFGWLHIETSKGSKSNIYSMNNRQYQAMKDNRDIRVELAREKAEARSDESNRRRLMKLQGGIVAQNLDHRKLDRGSTLVPSVGQLTEKLWVNICTETPSLELPSLGHLDLSTF